MTEPLRLTSRARADLRSIGRFTLKTWGRRQRDAYLEAIHRRFCWLAEDPRRGRARPDIREGYHSYPEGAHMIFYLVREGGIDILGVPHQAMDVAAHLGSR
ncbi:type II toxin-antitoxin system RelE/ParE family toxin [uncultured Amaricoccus sp.]|uniref:type II toxin-antitoxin system RelE/ParE family toxin n=1 Tax=uncultured Amaricoccus sp. TaxID=339341 RepID=UPI002626C76B|nr:type II toxin-antitoxin system RelE/ParE family toxin [uncultured Amaricoccus sp.]